jgi:hypothetical protein
MRNQIYEYKDQMIEVTERRFGECMLAVIERQLLRQYCCDCSLITVM